MSKLEEVLKSLIVPNEKVKEVRKLRNDNQEILSFSEKINYKLHDKTTWAAIGLAAYYIVDKDYFNAFNQVMQITQGWF